MIGGRKDLTSIMQDQLTNCNVAGQQLQWATGSQLDMRPIVTMAMMSCQMCSQNFSMSGKLSDHRTPVLAVNPSQSIEGPYCIGCAGKRDGLRSFMIDEARVALCKLWHQQLSLGSAYAALQHHQAHRLAVVSEVNANSARGNFARAPITGQAHTPVSAAAADVIRRMAAKKDAPGLDSYYLQSNQRRLSPSPSNDETDLSVPSNQDKYYSYAGSPDSSIEVVLPTSNDNTNRNFSNKRQKLIMNNPLKTTWTDQEDEILIEAVTTSAEQPFSRWSDLAHQLPGRVGKQIRDRWLNHLDPRIDRSPFTREDDMTLYQAHKLHGKRWVEISTKYFHCRRSENHVKNRWYSAAFKKFVQNEIGDDPFDGTVSGPLVGKDRGEEPSEEKKEN